MNVSARLCAILTVDVVHHGCPSILAAERSANEPPEEARNRRSVNLATRLGNPSIVPVVDKHNPLIQRHGATVRMPLRVNDANECSELGHVTLPIPADSVSGLASLVLVLVLASRAKPR